MGAELATYIQDTLDMIDMTVANYAQSVFVDFGGPIATAIRLGGIVALALLGLNVIMQCGPPCG